MAKASKNRASKQKYVSQFQLTLPGFDTPFSESLSPTNRWVILSKQIPWDKIVTVYQSRMGNDSTGAEGINPRVVIGAMIIKHLENFSDRDTVMHIQENIYMQYFLGYSSFSPEEPFDSSLFVEFRKRLGMEQVNQINDIITQLSKDGQSAYQKADKSHDDDDSHLPNNSNSDDKQEGEVTHRGKLIADATACPQDISYPRDLNLINDAREKTEELIDDLYDSTLHDKKPRTDRHEARKLYLRTAQKKKKSKKEIRKAVKKQLTYLNRNIQSVNALLDSFKLFPLNRHQHKYLLVVTKLYEQQKQMYDEKCHSIEDRIVSIHQPHVRPIVRGKANANTEFGAKIQVCLMNGFAFLEDLSWDAFNEGTRLISSVEKYKERFGYYPEEVLVDKIYCNRDNRNKLKERGIRLRAKPLGRPKAVEVEHVRPGERNPIEGKFGQAKTAYGMNRIKARLKQTSESWIATIVMVLNLVKLAGQVPYCLILNFFSKVFCRKFILVKYSAKIFSPRFIQLSSC